MFCGFHARVPRPLQTIYGLIMRPKSRPNPVRHPEEIHPSRGTDDMAALWGDALDEYRQITGQDFRDPHSQFHPLYLRLEACSEEGAILSVLESETQLLDTYLQGSGWFSRLRGALLPIAKCVLAVIEVGGEAAAASKVPVGKAIFVAVAILLKAAVNVSETLHALMDLLETFASYVACLEIDRCAPIEVGLRKITVQTLVEMLKTLAYAFQTIGHGRWVYFLRSLAGQGNEVLERSRRADNLMERDARFRVTSIHAMMKTLTAVSIPLVLQALESMECQLASLDAGVNNLSIEMSDHGQLITRVSNRHELRSTLHIVLSGVRMRRMETALASMARQLEAASPPAHTPRSLIIRIEFPDANFTRLSRMAGGLLGLARLLSGVEQSSLRGSIGILADGTTTDNGSDNDTTVVSLSGAVNVSSVLNAAHSVAVAVFTAFTRWTYIWPFQEAIGRNPDHARVNSIILIDAVGREMELRLDMSWDDVHAALLEQFRDREGLEYVQANSYNLLTENGTEQLSIIERDVWEQTMQAGMTVEMSIVVRQLTALAQCPYCNLAASQSSHNMRVIWLVWVYRYLQFNRWPIYHRNSLGCGREFLASASDVRIEQVDVRADYTESTQPDSFIPHTDPTSPSSPTDIDDAEILSDTPDASTDTAAWSLGDRDETPTGPTSDEQESRKPNHHSQRNLAPFRSVTVLHFQSNMTNEQLRLLAAVKEIKSMFPLIEQLDGPVVFINVHTTSCDALALFPDCELKHVSLPSLTGSRVRNLRSAWMQCLQSSELRTRGAVTLDKFNFSGCTTISGLILGRLWKWIVHPILKALDLLNRTPSHPLPHVTWCPTGLLTQLPLHAAGVYDSPQADHIFDFVVSSYTPSLSALLRCREGSSVSSPQPDMLVVAQPATPGLSKLLGTQQECARIRELLPASNFLNHEEATTAKTRSVMGQYPWLHLACHGVQDMAKTTQSGFILYDGRLTLTALMEIVSENAELAFLSACQTPAGDEKIPEESAHLAAGMLAVGFKGVVATMWSIWDVDAPVIVEAYYRKLLELRGSGELTAGYTGAAYALHEAMKVLRERVGEEKFERWIPFVHFGI
ncbi:hypothetical protein PENSPDRAFT_747858 [Peniophora sp. CONT]|nr:hypothetical protein PENSPDRAFT_747858 [Peniophora sp. CONT]